jgi:hypothetical protein
LKLYRRKRGRKTIVKQGRRERERDERIAQQIIKLFKYLFYTVDAAIGGICAL